MPCKIGKANCFSNETLKVFDCKVIKSRVTKRQR